MNVEKTIESILKNQARSDARFAAQFDRADERFRKWEVRCGKAPKRRVRLDMRPSRLEREAALNYRAVTQLERSEVSLRRDIRRLTQAQAATERALKALIKSMAHRSGGN